MLKYIFKTIYSYSFILMVAFFAGCGGENSNSFGISSLKNSFLNLIDSHSNNLTAIPSGGLYVFVTSYTNSTSVLPLTHNGNFTGISGADAYCNSHIPSSLSGTGSYKAMLVDGVNRVATTVGPNSSSGQKDWVFIKNTSYYRPDGKMVFTTNDAGLFDFSTGSLSYAFVDSFYLWDFGIWTGLQSNWKTVPSTQLCSSGSQPWTNGNASVQGGIGYANYKTGTSISAGSIPCQWKETQDPNSQGSMEMGILCVQEKPVTLKAKIGFLEDSQCYDNNAQGSPFTIPWSQCHEFKRHFDPATGVAVSSDVASPGSYRPVPGQVHLNFFNSTQTNPAGCYVSNLQSGLDGNISASQINACLKTTPAPDRVRITVVLDYKTNLAYNNSIGTIRSVWEKATISALNYLPYDQNKFFQTLFVDPNTQKSQVEPYFEVVLPLSGYWNATTKTYDLGTVDLLSSIPASLMNSMKLTLASWQGVVELHNRMEAPSESVEKIHFDMFINNPARNCVTCYTINFNSIYGSGAYPGNLFLTAPQADITISSELSVDIPLGHEFGHTIVQTAAPWTLTTTNNWAGQFRDSNNQNYGRAHNLYEYQDMSMALTEGIVNPIGRYLISGNRGNWVQGNYYLGTYQNGWQLDPIVDQTYSDYQRFRYEMWVRGISENSPEWNSRLQNIQSINSTFTDRNTNSNNEYRYDGFVHYLLQVPPYHVDSYYATGNYAPYVNQFEYRYDQMKLLGEILDGGPVNFKWVFYGDVVHPKNSRVSLKDLLTTLNELYDGSPLPANGSPEFNDKYLSIKSPFSPQSLGWKLIQKGLISKSEVDNLFRAVGMDQLANICGYPWALPDCQ
ncbi:DUF1554 domain-containing protein [Leptospira interrogans]|uniref:DUF1554 domain-containing protein n=2 Tax=Leptospira interrogans TaxID=173 RepID=UPI00029743E2|nr:DUF1554 domain-containing protein [Leptospira interrogans]ALO02026.1 hypothetical protein LIH_16930 [Leptospira interrogans serovar Hardjo-prajitno]EKO96378.1 PF07588 family protein [Leptospira interrogans str. Brem 329]MCD1167880.1 DUF1554 domain-containing protein [Leptospira interrogans]MCH1887914.1 DUF1554 domain-containing protein [Leptospira interrogans]MCH1894203.1 DUF1554 domain-containing protein [Leptospira interrogans]